MKVKLVKWVCQATGDEYFSESPPNFKDIEGERFVEVTQDFKRSHYIKGDSLTKKGEVSKDV